MLHITNAEDYLKQYEKNKQAHSPENIQILQNIFIYENLKGSHFRENIIDSQIISNLENNFVEEIKRYEKTGTHFKYISPFIFCTKKRKYYKLVQFSSASIEHLQKFEEFLIKNKRENGGEIVGDFHKSYKNKQLNSTNDRKIFVLFDQEKIIGTRTIEIAQGSLETEKFSTRNIDIFPSDPHTHIATDLVIDKEYRSLGIGKSLILRTNEYAKINGYSLYGSTAWKDTQKLYSSIGIEILDQLDTRIKYKWILN